MPWQDSGYGASFVARDPQLSAFYYADDEVVVASEKTSN
jgi:hypothetical protein